MNGIKLTTDIEFISEYEEARKKFFDFIDAMSKLTSEQRYQLSMECAAVTGTAALLQQFVAFMNNWGYQ